jgi:quercetin dioxygenase-like cupin family protein
LIAVVAEIPDDPLPCVPRCRIITCTRFGVRRWHVANAQRRGFRVARGADRFGEHFGVGIGTLSFKVAASDSGGALLVVEIVHHAKGGPARHVHHHQDEWFHVTEGEYVIEIGGQRHRLGPGDSAFGPRGVPHGWTYAGEGPGRITFVVAPAGNLEAFFREIAKANGPAPQDPAFWPPYDLALAGPPLDVE